jgi:lipopolysaccharide export system permease protein
LHDRAVPAKQWVSVNLIHRHIFANVVLTCGAAVGMFAFVLMIGNAMKDLLDLVLKGLLPVETSFRLVALLVPFVVSYALPMGMLTGILLVLGRMSADREIVALRASGVSVAWLSAPILFLAILGVALSTLINFQFMPVARITYHEELAAALRQNPLSFIVPKTFIRDFPDKIVYVGDSKGMKLSDVWVWELDKQARARVIYHARRGDLHFSEKENTLELIGYEVMVEYRDNKDPEFFSGEQKGIGIFGVFPWKLSLGKITGEQMVQRKLKWYTFGQLIEEWRRLNRPDPAVPAAEREKQQMRVQITIQEKFATAFSVLSFALVAIPLGIKVSRKETSANLGIGLALAMVYYFTTIVVSWFDNQPAFRPDLLMWLPNFAFQALGLWMFYQADRAQQ